PYFAKINISINEFNDNQTHLILTNNFIHDEQGYLRWRKKNPDPSQETYYDVFPLTGNLFMTQIYGEGTDKVGMYSYLGELIQEYTVPFGFHHEMVEKTPGGNLLIGANSAKYDETTIVELDRNTGELVKSWHMEDYVDENRPVNWYVRESA